MFQIAWITLNHRCNLHCQWCYQREVASSGKQMAFPMVEGLVQVCKDLSIGIVALIGGEPTLHRYFYKAVGAIKAQGMTASVVTNGIKFSSLDYTARARDAGLDEIVFSVKGSSREEYVSSTGVDAYQKARRAIRNIASSGMRHRLSVTVSRPVIENWAQWMAFVRSSEVQEINFSFEKPVMLSDSVSFDDRMHPRYTAHFIENIMYPDLVQSGSNFKIEFMCPQCFLSSGFIEQLEEEGHAFGGCTVVGKNGIAFDPEGRVLPCNHFVDYHFGQYGQDFSTGGELAKLTESSDMRQFYHLVKQAPCTQCAECNRWHKCGGGCRIFWFYQGAKQLLSVG